jgi:hypothetical protein
MACKSLVLSGGTVVLERWTGLVTHEELLAHNRNLVQDPSIARAASVIADCRAAQILIPTGRLHEIADIHEGPAGERKIARFAFLVAADVYDLAQQFVGDVARHGVTAIVFTSLDVACQWVGIDPKDVPWS